MLFDNGDGITCCLTLLPGETGGQPGTCCHKKRADNRPFADPYGIIY